MSTIWVLKIISLVISLPYWNLKDSAARKTLWGLVPSFLLHPCLFTQAQGHEHGQGIEVPFKVPSSLSLFRLCTCKAQAQVEWGNLSLGSPHTPYSNSALISQLSGLHFWDPNRTVSSSGAPLLLYSHSSNPQVRGKVRTKQMCKELTEGGMDKIIKHSHQVPTIWNWAESHFSPWPYKAALLPCSLVLEILPALCGL